MVDDRAASEWTQGDNKTTEVVEPADMAGTIPTVVETEEELYRGLVDRSIQQVESILATMRRDQVEINELKAETRAILHKLRAA